MINREFRKDIEGLRAIAVLPILLFHLNPAICPGGYIGVDIFFVISGYLITGMILADGEAFSLKRFYVRRFFRLFPALLVTLAISLVAGWWVLGPREYEGLARSAVTAAFGISNFHFLAAVDYFNASSLFHPLLHTWSLGVEEQFYLVWPALLLLARRWGKPIWLLAAVISALSLVAITLIQPAHPELVFYMMPFRMFEFGIGASVVAIERYWDRMPRSGHILAGGVGAALLATAFVTFDGQTPWPSAWSLSPSIATALLILSGRYGLWEAALGNGALRFVGRISYSLYLVHWPLITLYRHHVVTEPKIFELILLGLASVALGAALYAAVELPFRIKGQRHIRVQPSGLRRWLSIGPQPNRIGVASLALTCAGFLSAAGGVIVTSGFPSRLDRTRVQFLDKGLTFAGDLCSYRRSRCVFGDQSSSNVVYVMGDSHALNLIYGLDRLLREAGIKGIALYDHGCLFAYEIKGFSNGVPDEKCRRNVAEAYEYLAKSRDPIILAGDYAGYRNTVGPSDATAPLRPEEGDYYNWLGLRFQAGLEKLDARRRTVVFVKQAYTTGVDLAKCLAQPGSTAEKCAPWTLAQVQERYKQADQMIDAVAQLFPTVIKIDPKIVFCAPQSCITSSDDGLYFRDTVHLTNAGSDFLIQHAKGALLEGLTRRE